MPIQAHAADGTVHEFPDGTPDSVVDSAMKAYAAPKNGTGSDIAQSLVQGIKEGVQPMGDLVSGFGDLMRSGMNAAGIQTRDPSKPLQATNGNLPTLGGADVGMSYLPGMLPDQNYKPQTTAGQYAHTLGQFVPGAVAGPEGAIPKIASTVLPAVADEAAGQLTQGTKAEPYARTLAALLGAGGSGAASRAGTSLVGALKGGTQAAPSAVDAVAPTIQALKSTSQNAYADVFNNPANNPIISKEALGGLADDVKQIATDHGFKPALNPKAQEVINDVLSLPENNSTLAGLEMTRRLAGNVAQDYGTSDGALASKIKAKITDFMSNLSDKDLVGTEADTNPGATGLSGVDSLNTARSNWATMRKAEIIQKIQDDADIRGAANYTQAGSDTAIRRGFANLATNQSKMAQFSPDEQDAIRLIAKGSIATNALRFLGKFAARGPVSAYISSALGNAVGGPVGSAVMLGAGEAARAGASNATRNNVNALSALVRGGPDAAQQLVINRRAALANGLANYVPALMGSGMMAAQGGQ